MKTNLAMEMGTSAEIETAEIKIVKIADIADKRDVIDISRYRVSSRQVINVIYEEIRNFWTNKRKIREACLKVNKYNVCDFVNNMSIMSDSNEIFGEVKKYITCWEVINIVNALLNCAKRLNCDNTMQYECLRRDYCTLLEQYHKNRNSKVNDKDLKMIDNRLVRLFKIIKNNTY